MRLIWRMLSTMLEDQEVRGMMRRIEERMDRGRARGGTTDRQIGLDGMENGIQALAVTGHGGRVHRSGCGSQANQIASDPSGIHRWKP